ncbi:MAG: hypothetical protein ACYSSP_13270 [Planctomycetota bacterium]|jgi:hypothetical protein
MAKKRYNLRKAYTLTEVAVVIIIFPIIIISIGTLVVDTQRGWGQAYARTYGDVASDSQIARIVFEGVVRNACKENLLLADDGSSIKVYYYKSVDSSSLDCYARFYTSEDELIFERGTVYQESEQQMSVSTVCRNVTSCVFRKTGSSIQMILTLDGDQHTATVTSSAVAHNM